MEPSSRVLPTPVFLALGSSLIHQAVAGALAKAPALHYAQEILKPEELGVLFRSPREGILLIGQFLAPFLPPPGGENCTKLVLLTSANVPPREYGTYCPPGTRAVLSSNCGVDILVRVLELVAQDFLVLPAAMRRPSPLATLPVETSTRLTVREVGVLQSLAEGLSEKEAAGRLGISFSTVRTYLDRIKHKLGASSRVQAVALGVGHGIIVPKPGRQGSSPGLGPPGRDAWRQDEPSRAEAVNLATSKPEKVIIASPSGLAIESIKRALVSTSFPKLVCEARTVNELNACLSSESSSLIIISGLPPWSVSVIERAVSTRGARVALIMRTDRDVSGLVSAGVRAIVTSDIQAEYLTKVLELVCEEMLVLPAQNALTAIFQEAGGSPGRNGAVLDAREIELLEFIAAGLSEKEIAKTLSMSQRTIYTRLARVQEKLGAENLAHTVALAVAQGLIRPGT